MTSNVILIRVINPETPIEKHLDFLHYYFFLFLSQLKSYDFFKNNSLNSKDYNALLTGTSLHIHDYYPYS